jgi:transposase, IS5 family
MGAVMGQTTFSSLAWSKKGKVTRRERFLSEMDGVIPWDRLVALIEPHYPKPGNGRPPIGLERMLRVYFMQQWFNLSDPQAEDSLYDSESMRRFARIELGDDRVPDETTILRFRHLLEHHRLTEAMFLEVQELLEEKRLIVRSGTIVDATILAAPSSTKNAKKSRDPEMRQTKKGNEWHFGMKAHVGTDVKGIVHSLVTTDAATSDVSQMPELIHGRERALYGDRAYWNETDRKYAKTQGIRYRVQRRGKAGHPLTPYQKMLNRVRSRIRARGEHAFHVVKRLWGHNRVRYRGLAKEHHAALQPLCTVQSVHAASPPSTCSSIGVLTALEAPQAWASQGKIEPTSAPQSKKPVENRFTWRWSS